MPIPSKFTCKSCLTEITFDVPDFDNAVCFADKVPCSKCGQVGCTYLYKI